MPVWLAGIFVKKNIKWFALAIVLIGVIATGYFAVKSYNQTITDNAVLEANNKQLEQNIKDKDELDKKLEKLDEINDNILNDTQAQNTLVIERHDRVDSYINSSEAQQSNRPTSDVIKNTIRMLKDEE